MSNQQVPKVDISETVTQLAVPRQNTTVIGIVGSSQLATVNGVTTEANKVYRINSVSQAESYFGSNVSLGKNLIPMIKRAFDGGAAEIHAVSVGETDEDTFAVLASGVVQGNTQITVSDGTQFTANDEIYIGTNESYKYEEKRKVASKSGNVLTLDAALTFTHYAQETVQVVNANASTVYEDAITALGADEEKVIVVCEDNSDSVASLMAAMVEDSVTDKDSPCIYVRGLDEAVTEAQAKTKATAANNDRTVMLWPTLRNLDGKVVTGGEVAAAVAGSIAGNGVPKLNHNFTELVNFSGVADSITDYDALILAGVCPIELKYNTIRLSRFVTSWVSQNGVTDKTWQEGAIRLNVDYIERIIKQRLTLKFLQSGNTPTVREAIKQEVLSALKSFAAQDILLADETFKVPAYKDPVVTVDPSDSSTLNVDVEISPGRPLNFIKLNFKLYL